MVSKRVVSADVPQERKPERGYVRQNHPFTKPPFYLPVTIPRIMGLESPEIGACAMTTKFLDNKICTFKIVLSWRFPRKTAFWDDFPLLPPHKNANCIFIVVSPSLKKFCSGKMWNRSKAESRKIDSESPLESYPINA